MMIDRTVAAITLFVLAAIWWVVGQIASHMFPETLMWMSYTWTGFVFSGLSALRFGKK